MTDHLGASDDTDEEVAFGDDRPIETTARHDETSVRGVPRSTEPPAPRPGPASLTLVGAIATLIGVFATWSSDHGITLNGIEGPHNGWVAVLYALAAMATTPFLRRSSWPAMLSSAFAGVAVTVTAVTTHSAPGASAGWGLWMTLLAGLLIAAASGWAILDRLRLAESEPWTASSARLPKSIAGGLGVFVSILLFLVLGQVLVVEESKSWPPGPDAITAQDARRVTEEFVSGDPRPRDLGLDYAWSTAATIEPWAEGFNFFPRIFADIEAARSSVHIIMFGWNAEDVGSELAALLQRKLVQGVDVRVIVDSQGSDPYGAPEDMYTKLAQAGAEIVVNDVIQLDSDGLFTDRSLDWRQDETGRADHRKLYVIDGNVAWTGGAGLEDHFRNGGFHDVMVRVTGDVVLQAQSVFLTSFRTHGALVPADLSIYFPNQSEPGSIPIAIVQVVPGGYASATQAIREMIDTAEHRLDIMNPYLIDKDVIERIIDAAEREVTVRIVVSETSNNSYAEAALRHRYNDLLDAGVEIWEYPDAVVHAKLIVADDTVNFGTVNLDNWALYRNFEIAMVAKSPATAALIDERVFVPDIARSTPGQPPSGFAETLEGWVWDKLTYFL